MKPSNVESLKITYTRLNRSGMKATGNQQEEEIGTAAVEKTLD